MTDFFEWTDERLAFFRRMSDLDATLCMSYSTGLYLVLSQKVVVPSMTSDDLYSLLKEGILEWDEDGRSYTLTKKGVAFVRGEKA